MSLSRFISIALHPIFMPILSIYILLNECPEIIIMIGKYISYIYGVLFWSSIIFPLISIAFLIKNKKINSVEMYNHKERPQPLLIVVIFMLLGLYLVNNLLIYTPLLKSVLVGGILITIFAAIISIFWKISLHMLGIGGIVGLLIYLQFLKTPSVNLLVLFIFLSGILGVARLKQKAHTQKQIYVGYISGIIIFISTLLFY